jgi:DNA-directed RNA polymerase I, II, and III subunit RPABC2
MNKLTKYEKAKILGTRAVQLMNGSKPMVDTRGETNALRIASMELLNRKMPLKVVRRNPDGSINIYDVNAMVL